MKGTMTKTLREHPEKVIIETCELWGTVHISDNLRTTILAFKVILIESYKGQHLQCLQSLFVLNPIDKEWRACLES